MGDPIFDKISIPELRKTGLLTKESVVLPLLFKKKFSLELVVQPTVSEGFEPRGFLHNRYHYDELKICGCHCILLD